jgi:2,3-bisphosphoglycerate-dependent phosphoglycerate mutase/probable phosphoglycerate mutase
VSLRRLVLLRHGQTDYNLAARMQGHLDSLLTETGLAQATAAAPAIARLTPDLLISSDLRRAVDTADVMGAATGLPVKLDPRLRETHLGEWQGRTVTEIEQDWPGAIATWRSDPAWAPPGEELDEQFGEGSNSTALLVAHGGLIAGLVSGLLALPAATWPSIGGVGNCRWAALARRDDHPRWRLVGYNVGVAT